MADTLALEVEVYEVGIFRMLTHELFNGSEDSEGEVFNSHFNLILGFLDNQSEDFAFDVGIINGGVRFIKIKLTRCEAVGGFGRGLEILSAFGLPSVAEASCLVIIIIHNVFTGQAPEVKQGIDLATEAENIGVKFFGIARATAVCDFFANGV